MNGNTSTRDFAEAVCEAAKKFNHIATMNRRVRQRLLEKHEHFNDARKYSKASCYRPHIGAKQRAKYAKLTAAGRSY